MKYLIKLTISLLLLYLIGRNVNWQEMLQAFFSLSPFILLCAILLQLVSNGLAALRWQFIMRSLNIQATYLFCLACYLKSLFFAQGLPSSIGGDAIRVLDASRLTTQKEDAAFSVLIDRIMGLLGLVLLNLVAIIFHSTLLEPKMRTMLISLLLMVVAAVLVLTFPFSLIFFQRRGPLGILHRLARRIQQTMASPMQFIVQLGLAILVHLIVLASFYLLALGVGLQYPFSVYLTLVPPAFLMTILPISLAGWGVREGALVGLFLFIGAPREVVLSCSMLFGLGSLCTSLVGLLAYLVQQKKL